MLRGELTTHQLALSAVREYEVVNVNEKNLIPQAHKLTVEEQSKGGKASAESRKRRKNLKQKMQLLLSLPANDADATELELLGISDADDMDNEMVVAKAMFLAAANGDVKAFDRIQDILGRSVAREQLALEQKKFKAEHAPQVNTNIYHGIPATMIAPPFLPVLFDIHDEGHSEYLFPGGRGSTKSSFVSLSIIDLLETHPDMNALIMRQVGNTLKDSVYAQITWAIVQLGLEQAYTFSKSPLQITKKATGQTIFFRGCDEPTKAKGIKPVVGYIGILWLEELDQFGGEEAVRSLEQSAIRGGDLAYVFKTFNPPKSALNWANRYAEQPSANRLTMRSTYHDVPRSWLGKVFLEIAEHLKRTNPKAYENEYEGKANGTGGSVFDNLELREISDAEISEFDFILNGVDWGWYPDLYAFARCHYDTARHTLYIWDEFTCNKKSNEETAKILQEQHGITAADEITCDSAEQKSVGDYRAYGLAARPAEKGPESRRYSYKWLQSLVKIVIDPVRCPEAAKEFREYEYERDKEGNVISGYPDGNDHMIDAVRYATNRQWKRRGQ